jgi:glyoxylase-like metal-dependent hydrolase (beta-lactamase superfamily II)
VHVIPVLDGVCSFFEPFAEAFSDVAPEEHPEDGVWWLSFRAYVVESAGRVVLVDTGAASDTPLRPSWGPPADGHLVDRLREQAGIEADDVTDVVLTHLHADHAAGSVTATGEPAFRNARYVVQEAESGSPLAEPFRRTGQLQVCAGATALTTDVRLLPTPGHTPGHQSVLVTDGEEVVVLAGDVFLHEVQVRDPSVRYHYDADDEAARRSREQVLRILTERGGRLGTAHLRTPYLPLAQASL